MSPGLVKCPRCGAEPGIDCPNSFGKDDACPARVELVRVTDWLEKRAQRFHKDGFEMLRMAAQDLKNGRPA